MRGLTGAQTLLENNPEVKFRKVHGVIVRDCENVEQTEDPKKTRAIAIFLKDLKEQTKSKGGPRTLLTVSQKCFLITNKILSCTGDNKKGDGVDNWGGKLLTFSCQ